MDSFAFTPGKDAIEAIGEALDTALPARRRRVPQEGDAAAPVSAAG